MKPNSFKVSKNLSSGMAMRIRCAITFIVLNSGILSFRAFDIWMKK